MTAIHSLFLCLYPETEARLAFGAAQESLRAEFGVDGGLTAFDRIHLSLAGFGEFAPGPDHRWTQRIARILKGVRMRPFRIALNTLVSFRSSKPTRPVVMTGEDGVVGVSMLLGALGRELRANGVGHGVASTPHVTLGWSDVVVPEQHVEPVTWKVREFVLIDSILGAGRHEILGRFPLMSG